VECDAAAVRLSVYDALGRQVAMLIDGAALTAGVHNVRFDGARLAAGVYFYRLQASDYVAVRKMVLMK